MYHEHNFQNKCQVICISIKLFAPELTNCHCAHPLQFLTEATSIIESSSWGKVPSGPMLDFYKGLKVLGLALDNPG